MRAEEIPVFWSTEELCIADIPCGATRRALLGLEPGSRIWLQFENESFLFERAADDEAGGSRQLLIPALESADRWKQLCASLHPMVMELDFIERPIDRPDRTRHMRPG